MPTENSVIMIDTNLIIPNKYQPRKVFDDKALESLTESIKNYGIINPLLVRKKDDKYEIIAGERRYRAAKRAGLQEVPVIIKNADEQQMAELALIENIQRQGLTPIEEAKSYEEIMRIGNHTQQGLAEKLGKSQSSIANKIRLLSLPQEIQDALANKKISERHARSLISVVDKERQIEILNRIINEKLTVKETEQIINEKEINEEEIKQAISDIMKSLNIKEEEKEDDNMNNGNFFPNYDNTNNLNNNASLNMMNMQSMNQAPIAPEPEMVMPTMAPVGIEPQLVVPTPENQVPNFEQFGPIVAPEVNLNNNPAPMDNYMNMANNMMPQENVNVPTMPAMDAPVINEAPLYGPQMMEPTPVMNPQPVVSDPDIPVMAPQMQDVPLFNPNVVMPTVDNNMPMNETLEMPEQLDQTLIPPVAPIIEPTNFEIPVTSEPSVEIPLAADKLTELQNLLTMNGYSYKVYSNETDNCVIIELPKN